MPLKASPHAAPSLGKTSLNSRIAQKETYPPVRRGMQLRHAFNQHLCVSQHPEMGAVPPIWPGLRRSQPWETDRLITCRKNSCQEIAHPLDTQTFPPRLRVIGSVPALTERPNPFPVRIQPTRGRDFLARVSAEVRMSRIGFKLSTVGDTVSPALGLRAPILVHVE